MARRLWRLVLDTLLPPQCLACNALVPDPGTLCPSCWEGIDFLGPPWCECCGQPFSIPTPAGTVCGACLAAPPPWRRARAVFRYDAHAKALVLRFKHADRTDAAPAYAGWMARAGAEVLAEAELIAPVPLHWLRLARRRYNQAALLALGLGRISGVPVVPDLLERMRATASQGVLGRRQRADNVRRAFRLRAGAGPRVEGRAVLLVDDVLTTGATVAECAKVLTRAGARTVDVLTLARVVLSDG